VNADTPPLIFEVAPIQRPLVGHNHLGYELTSSEGPELVEMLTAIVGIEKPSSPIRPDSCSSRGIIHNFSEFI
jgi:hypothetical protein